MRQEAVIAPAAGFEPAGPAGASPADAPPADAVPADAVPADALPADALPADALPADARPARSLSPSRAADFLTCPLLYRFRVIDRLPEPPSAAAARGTLVHAVLERLFDVPAPARSPPAGCGLRAGAGTSNRRS